MSPVNPKPFLKVFGAAIREKRTQLAISQEDFAELVGVHRTYLGSVERGERNISLKNIIRISNAFGLKPSALIALAEVDSIQL